MKRSKIIFWITTIFLFLFEGMMPLATILFAPEHATPGATHLGYPEYFTYTLIVFKVIGTILLIIPRLPRPLKEWTYAGFGFDFIYACVSHVVVDGPQLVSFFPLLMLVILIVSYIHYFRAYPASQN
jgi:DoxX-like family